MTHRDGTEWTKEGQGATVGELIDWLHTPNQSKSLEHEIAAAVLEAYTRLPNGREARTNLRRTGLYFRSNDYNSITSEVFRVQIQGIDTVNKEE